jgi:5-methyltetrahydrofolate--homocysteine methyltransferase
VIIIGEKINGSIPAVAEAIARRDAEFIRRLAIAQEQAGAACIDLCASVPEEQEVENLKWMVGCIESATELPISLDSPSADVLAEAWKFCRRPGILNSVSCEGDKLDRLFPILAENQGWQVIALLCDDTGIPPDAAGRLKIFDRILARAAEYGIDPGRIHIDPLVQMLCTSENGIATILEVISAVRARCPAVHITAAVSNVSFNLPARRLLNLGFTVLAMNAGLDCIILDPTDRDLMGALFATEALLGRDEYCMDYIGAYRRGLFGSAKNRSPHHL